MIITLVIGCFIGWLAGKIFKSSGNGLILNILLGLAGSFVGGKFLGNLLGEGTIAQIITGTLGAIFILWIISLIRKGKN